ncbi:hypothetical protein F2Z80_23590 [Vibrio fortis]|uniref:Phage protein n=2 Tax=Vibrio TaxID=662 RepID=A0A5N3RZR4_9VIBR|nr:MULTISPECIES: hypothetical protein [Vibrio]KAB0300096.1 hypothetical protein F2Z80_23590 [Vibrio fortis]PQJ63642.1 hypothetical protein BTO10_02165 [Vibrio chagasii]
MDEEFKKQMEDKLSEYRQWTKEHLFTSCKLVHYVGVDRPNAFNFEPTEIEDRISGCIAEGFYVDWHTHKDCLYICVQEPDCPVPTWEQVIAQEAIADVDEILRNAGFDPSA